jgi:hypothetical protein
MTAERAAVVTDLRPARRPASVDPVAARGATARTEPCSDDGGAVSRRLTSFGEPKNAGMASAKPMAPVISAAARTRAHFSLMFLP